MLIAVLALIVQPATAHYRAEPTTSPAAARPIVRGQMWTCAGGTCTTGVGDSRPAIVCAALVRELGALRSFTVRGRAFSAEELSRCNRRAR